MNKKLSAALFLSRYALVLSLFLSVIVLFLDYFTGPFIQLPVLFLLPVGLAAWFKGMKWGVALANGLCIVRSTFTAFLWVVPWSLTEAVIDSAVQIILMTLFAFLFAQLGALSREVKILRGLVIICCVCKIIRCHDERWEQPETYIEKRSEAKFSHGICPECAVAQYGEFLEPPEPERAGRDTP